MQILTGTRKEITIMTWKEQLEKCPTLQECN